MTREEKQLLFKDICARLPYGVKVHCEWNLFRGNRISEDGELVSINIYDDSIQFKMNNGRITEIPFNRIDGTVLPYLRPMSSMTEEEKIQLSQYACIGEDLNGEFIDEVQRKDCAAYVDWLNAHHFDYRGLIPMGLALEAPNNMYKSE